MTVKIRASSLSDLFDCPARWAARHIDGKLTPSTARAQLGKAVHASTAVYDQSVIDGLGLSIDEAAAAAVDVIHLPTEPVEWEDETPSDVEKIALALHGKYCAEIAPKQSYRAVEVRCDNLEITDIGITLTGTTDRIRETDAGFSIADIKTGKAAVSATGEVTTKGHAYQIGVYELLAEFSSGLPITAPAQIVGLNAAKTDKAQRVATAEIIGARQLLVGDEDSPGILQNAATLVNSGVFWGNPKSMLCHERYCPIYTTCNYRK